ncbi:S9 family peptidase [Frateuria soli]|uniref:S9 family peptidase n=1 Tax=Frateuria soli TaxID=1542730 RepID=UPI001E302987|nr:prolyl oligopeptidase family serine peptidase [Frateuria soli]UGB38137.1 prolyl oligopeptidase family serine peptidase [Frateuria soli]
MRRLFLAGLAALTALPALATTAAAPLDLETIMANPDWIGQAVESPYWSADGQAIYYQLKRDGSEVRDLYRVDPATGRSEKLDPAAVATADGPAVYDRTHRYAAFVRHGDVFLRMLADGRTVQVTQTVEDESAPQFSADSRALQYRSGNDWYSYDLARGISAPVAVLKFADDPDAKKTDALEAEQLELFSTLRRLKADKEAEKVNARALAAADPGRTPEPFWLGDKVVAIDTELSPDGRWLLVVTRPKDYEAGRQPRLTHYVSDSGYAEGEDAHVYVNHNAPAAQSLMLLDLREHRRFALPTDTLPGIKDDPLAALRAQTVAALKKAGKDEQAKALAAPEVRPLRIVSSAEDGGGGGIVWSTDGRNLAIQLRAIDNKDRWIASVDFDRHALVSQHRLHDDAWINWNFNDFGWLKDGRTLWYLSEETGWSQLYVKPLDGKAKALTSGRFEVSHPQLSEDGRWFYLRTNQVAPYSYDVYRVPSAGGDLARVSRYQGMEQFALSPDGNRLAVLHSSSYVLPQLAVQPAAGGTPRELTDTMKSAFTARDWIAPRIVEVPSSHGAGTIYAKFYGAEDNVWAKPAVIFVHGAGYTQNVNLSWTYYFREQMFHNMLVQKGYVVLDMDYRASEGYGRDWRVAIYRQMGHPELEDLLDGKAWLVKHHHVDPKRVGIYGGSYGGFMTEMALLRAPGEFAAGAALRPVSDWRLYNHEYTANILNTPELDPHAYATSSPINFADQLADPLLIEHGLIDDNVLAADSIRLYQRFIELHKKDFWMSLYPMERHGFVHADSWYDEYRRINELFDTYVKQQH